MKEHNKLSEEEIVKLKNTLLQLNGALLRLGISKEDTHIVYLNQIEYILIIFLVQDKVV